MDLFYKQLRPGKKHKNINKEVADYISGLKTQQKFLKETLPRYQLWVESLRRSSKYKAICDWFVEARQQYPYPELILEYKLESTGIEDYLFFAHTYENIRESSPFRFLKDEVNGGIPMLFEDDSLFEIIYNDSFFLWAKKAKYPTESGFETLMNLFVFGNIFIDYPDVTTLRIFHLIDRCNKARVIRTEGVIDVLFKHIEREIFNKDEIHPAEEYRKEIKKFFKSNFFLSFCLTDPFENVDATLEEIKGQIEKRRESIEYKNEISEQYSFYNPGEFEYPISGSFRLDDLTTYLKVYDMKCSGMKVIEIAKEHFNLDQKEALLSSRMITRYIQKAKKVIQNTEKGIFPGEYS
jgi:hypothetical protein